MKTILVGLVILISSTAALADNSRANWKRDDQPIELTLQLFHANDAVNLPTAETIGKNEMEFQIMHRFYPPVSDGFDQFYGFDGPAGIRLGLAFGITDRMMITLGRSNLNDNVDLRLKYKAFNVKSDVLPTAIAFQGGIGWNTVKTITRDRTDSRNFQYYLQGIINAMPDKRIGLGLIPSYTYNSDIHSADYEYVLTLGSYVQYYVGYPLSFLVEWNPRISGDDSRFNSASFGIELETGGHFFKIILTNSTMLNPSQYLPGADYKFKSDEWRIGFNITRLLSFN
ncbi:MAG: DUF5777 family beta-barrel protein [Candidatus Zixiibacteriota bacterium]